MVTDGTCYDSEGIWSHSARAAERCGIVTGKAGIGGGPGSELHLSTRERTQATHIGNAIPCVTRIESCVHCNGRADSITDGSRAASSSTSTASHSVYNRAWRRDLPPMQGRIHSASAQVGSSGKREVPLRLLQASNQHLDGNYVPGLYDTESPGELSRHTCRDEAKRAVTDSTRPPRGVCEKCRGQPQDMSFINLMLRGSLNVTVMCLLA